MTIARALAAPVVATAFVLAPAAASADESQLAALAWLSGCWAADGRDAGSGEQWMAPAGGSMLGVGRTVRNGRTVDHEFMQIRAAPDGRLVFIARPSGQPEGTFPLARLGDGEVVFENPQHDFPQRVIYKRLPGQRVAARIEGLRGGQPRAIDFALTRVACD